MDQDHHLESHALERAAFERCYICRVLWRAISDKSPSVKITETHTTKENAVNSEPVSRYRVIPKPYWSKHISEVNFTLYKNGTDEDDQTFTFYLSSMERKADLFSNSIAIHLP